MLSTLIVALMLAQAPCAGAGALTDAAAKVAVLDLKSAAAVLDGDTRADCGLSGVAGVYLQGLLAARLASASGGDAAALAPARDAASRLERLAAGRVEYAEIARLALLAAMAAAQSEREEMAVFLAQALSLESLRLAAGEAGAPVVPVHVLAGDLWLQVDPYDDARAAYLRARAQVGDTPAIALGLARAAARLDDAGAACTEYRALLALWQARADAPARELLEAHTYLRGLACAGGAPVR